MTPDKAIEILRLARACVFEGDEQDLEKAQQFGIEALERLNDMRTYKTLVGLASSLPGRTLPSEDEVGN